METPKVGYFFLLFSPAAICVVVVQKEGAHEYVDHECDGHTGVVKVHRVLLV
jgi:hypothetical protein